MMTEREKMAQIIAEYLCPQGKAHKTLYGAERICYSRDNFAECEKVSKCVDALIAAGIGDLKEHRIFAGKDGSIKQLYSGEEVEQIVKEREEYKHRAEVAERALYIACFNYAKLRYVNGINDMLAVEYANKYKEQAEKELTEESKDEQSRKIFAVGGKSNPRF